VLLLILVIREQISKGMLSLLCYMDAFIQLRLILFIKWVYSITVIVYFVDFVPTGLLKCLLEAIPQRIVSLHLLLAVSSPLLAKVATSVLFEVNSDVPVEVACKLIKFSLKSLFGLYLHFQLRISHLVIDYLSDFTHELLVYSFKILDHIIDSAQ
jgi:hypothetical protein